MRRFSWGLLVLAAVGCSDVGGSNETDVGSTSSDAASSGSPAGTTAPGGDETGGSVSGGEATGQPEDTEGSTGGEPEPEPDPVDLTACRTWAEGLDDADDGATRDFYNRGAGLPWRNYLGDWLDADGAEQGDTPYATATLTDDDTGETASLDVTVLVQRWVDDDVPARGFFLRQVSGSGPFDFASREHADAAAHPALILQTSDGEVTLEAVADTSLRASTYQAAGQEQELRVQGEEPALVRFDLSGLEPGSVRSATLQVTSTDEFGSGTFELGVFEAAPGPLDEPPAPELGLASDYPGDAGIEGDASVVFTSTFEDDDWGTAWTAGSDAASLSLVAAEEGFEPLSGQALRVTVPEGENTGLNLRYRFMDEQGEEPEAIYLRYYLRFSDAWQPADGGKLPGSAGTYGVAGWGGRPVDGTDGWSARGVYRASPPEGNPFAGSVSIGNYVYHADMEGQFGDNEYYLDHCGGVLAKNHWYAVEQYVQLNTPGENDGIIRAWVDGRLVEEKTDWRWRDVDTLRIEEVWMNVYHGGTAPAPQDLVLYIDNVVVAQAYVGPASFK